MVVCDVTSCGVADTAASIFRVDDPAEPVKVVRDMRGWVRDRDPSEPVDTGKNLRTSTPEGRDSRFLRNHTTSHPI
jgi:hypothetical protein